MILSLSDEFEDRSMRILFSIFLLITAPVLASSVAESKPSSAIKLTRAQVDLVCGKGSCYLMKCGNGHHCNYSCDSGGCFGYCIDCGVKSPTDAVLGGVKK